jgi:hypothetical protein
MTLERYLVPGDWVSVTFWLRAGKLLVAVGPTESYRQIHGIEDVKCRDPGQGTRPV